MKTMLVARMHKIGAPLQLDTLPIPEPGPTDVLVAVKACNLVPNLKNVLTHWPELHPEMPLPELPASSAWTPPGSWPKSAAKCSPSAPAIASTSLPVSVADHAAPAVAAT